jgi:hypothetical protein
VQRERQVQDAVLLLEDGAGAFDMHPVLVGVADLLPRVAELAMHEHRPQRREQRLLRGS